MFFSYAFHHRTQELTTDTKYPPGSNSYKKQREEGMPRLRSPLNSALRFTCVIDVREGVVVSKYANNINITGGHVLYAVITTHDRPKRHVFPYVYTPCLVSITMFPRIPRRRPRFEALTDRPLN